MGSILDFSKSKEWADIIYNTNPHPKRINEFRDFLERNKDTKVRLYHGTNAEFNILEDGLKPTSKSRRRSYQSSPGYVYLSIHPGMAKTFGELGYPMKDISVYSVDLLVRKLKADLDQLRNQRYWAKKEVGNTLVESLIYGHGARVRGEIYPYMLSKIY